MDKHKTYLPIGKKMRVILAEDDSDDRLLFREAVDELPVSVDLLTFKNGDELMVWLNRHTDNLPDVLFLDLNMPRKNGFATLGEIKRNTKLQDLPVIIFSTAQKEDMIRQVFNDAAHYYICKPIDFSDLKALLYKSLSIIANHNKSLPTQDDFMLNID